MGSEMCIRDRISTGQVASTGTVMVAMLPIILGFQLLLNFLAFDMANEPKLPLQPAPSLTDLLGSAKPQPHPMILPR